MVLFVTRRSAGARSTALRLGALALAVALLGAGCGTDGTVDAGSPAGDDAGGQVVVDSWGGGFQEDQSRLLFDPFTEATGVQVVQLSDGENIYAKIEAQAGREVGEIDVVHGDASWLLRGRAQGLWHDIDYDVVDPSELYEDARESDGIGILYWSFNIVSNTEVFPDGGPATWREVWDHASDNPGRVALWGARPNYVLEAALMAAGYAPDEVYPLSEDRIDEAYASLDEIKDAVRWYEGGAQGARLFADGEVDVGMYYGGEAFGLIDDGEPLRVEWNEGLYTRDYWLVPANAPNPAGAMRLIAFALEAQRQAAFAEETGYGPVNPGAGDLIDGAMVERLPSVEPNKALQVDYDFEWWGANDDEQLERWNAWLRS